jgi:ribosomal protein L11 methylase PrmA
VRAFRVSGPERLHVLDLLHVHGDVAGVWEQDDAVVVWLRDPLPGHLRTLRGVTIDELPPSASAASTGREHDQAVLVADDLLVRPPWVPRPAGFQGLELVVPRGSAFGSGEHGSTRAALRCLHATWREPVASFADVGTGSGILALYAVLRGAHSVTACDVDPAAVRAARELVPSARVCDGGPEALPAPVDCLVANLDAAEIDAALEAILAHWTGRRALVLSGMRPHEVAKIAARLPRQPNLVHEQDGFRAVALTDARGPRP